MNPERSQLKGMLAESKKRYRCIDTESSGLILLLRSLLNPYEEIINIDTEKIVVTSIRLKALQDEMKTLSSKIKNLEAELE